MVQATSENVATGGAVNEPYRGVRLLVCGGREFVDVPKLWRELDNFQKRAREPGVVLVIDGASDDVTGPYMGADYWAHQWALARDIPTVRQHAKWESQGKAAGPIRNQEMLERHKPNCVIAFKGGRGTANMVGLAKDDPTVLRVYEIG